MNMSNYIYKDKVLSIKTLPSHSYRSLRDKYHDKGTPDSWYYLCSPNSKDFQAIQHLDDKEFTLKINPDLIDKAISFFKAQGLEKQLLDNLRDNEYALGFVHVQFNKREKTDQFSMHIGIPKQKSKAKRFFESFIFEDKSKIVIDFSENIIDVQYSDTGFEWDKKSKTGLKKQNLSFKDAIWFACKPWNNIAKDICKIIYKENRAIVTKDFKDLFLSYLNNQNPSDFNEFIIKYLYSFRDNTTSYLDHQIRNNRNQLEKEGYLIKKDGMIIATKKLILDDIKGSINKFNEFIERSKVLLGLSINGDNDVIIKKIIDSDQTTTKQVSIKEIEEDKRVKSLRRVFINSIDKQLELMCDVLEEKLSTFIVGNNFERPERAHIIPVSHLYQNDRWEDIANHNNGIILDPNTHTLLDAGLLTFNDDFHLIYTDTKKVYSKINSIFLNAERKQFIKEYIDLFK